WKPSGGTLSSAKGTTRPIVTSLLMSVVPRSLGFSLGSLWLSLSSLDADRASRLHYLPPAHGLALDVVAELLRRARGRQPAESGEVRLGVRRRHDLVQGLVELHHDWRRRFGGRYDRDPGVRLIASDASLMHGRSVRHGINALGGRHR